MFYRLSLENFKCSLISVWECRRMMIFLALSNSTSYVFYLPCICNTYHVSSLIFPVGFLHSKTQNSVTTSTSSLIFPWAKSGTEKKVLEPLPLTTRYQQRSTVQSHKKILSSVFQRKSPKEEKRNERKHKGAPTTNQSMKMYPSVHAEVRIPYYYKVWLWRRHLSESSIRVLHKYSEYCLKGLGREVSQEKQLLLIFSRDGPTRFFRTLF